MAATLSFKSPVVEGGSVLILGETTDYHQGDPKKRERTSIIWFSSQPA